METPNNDLPSFNAVMLGALASGVNGPTWLVLRMVFLMLGVCLSAMLALAFSSSDFAIAGHVLLLVIISAMLFIFLNGFLQKYVERHYNHNPLFDKPGSMAISMEMSASKISDFLRRPAWYRSSNKWRRWVCRRRKRWRKRNRSNSKQLTLAYYSSRINNFIR